MTIGLVLIAIWTLGVGLFIVVAPGVFYETLGPFGTRNDHYAIDGATFQLALGIGAVVAIRQRSWRLPVVAMVTFQNIAHAINHAVDIQKATPAWIGVLDFAVLAIASVLLVWLLTRTVNRLDENG